MHIHVFRTESTKLYRAIGKIINERNRLMKRKQTMERNISHSPAQFPSSHYLMPRIVRNVRARLQLQYISIFLRMNRCRRELITVGLHTGCLFLRTAQTRPLSFPAAL